MFSGKMDGSVCGWCKRSKPSQYSTLASASNSQRFCSEHCFTQSRRATFKKRQQQDVISPGSVNEAADTAEVAMSDQHLTPCSRSPNDQYLLPEGGHADGQSVIKNEYGAPTFLPDMLLRHLPPLSFLGMPPPAIRGASCRSRHSDNSVANSPLLSHRSGVMNGSPRAHPTLVSPPTTRVLPSPSCVTSSPPAAPSALTNTVLIPQPIIIPLPIPVPIPIPIFMNAPEIADVLDKYFGRSKKAANHDNPTVASYARNTAPTSTNVTDAALEANALDLRVVPRSTSPVALGVHPVPVLTSACPPMSTAERLCVSSESIMSSASLRLQDYRGRRRRILDAPECVQSLLLDGSVGGVNGSAQRRHSSSAVRSYRGRGARPTRGLHVGRRGYVHDARRLIATRRGKR